MSEDTKDLLAAYGFTPAAVSTVFTNTQRVLFKGDLPEEEEEVGIRVHHFPNSNSFTVSSIYPTNDPRYFQLAFVDSLKANELEDKIKMRKRWFSKKLEDLDLIILKN